MIEFSVRQASISDAAAIVRLVNRAFQVERFFKNGDRTDLDEINGLLNDGIFLLLSDRLQLAGCVFVRIHGERGYVGLLSVDPGRQRTGIGSLLMHQAEDYCTQAGCQAVDLRIISLRPELLAFYRKRGYVEGGIEPGDVVKGAKLPVHFILMAKDLG